jgi:tetratricopeptide (TPR) repeat protein
MRSGMDVSLSRLPARILLVAGAVACAGAITWAAGRNWMAVHWFTTRNPADWNRAIQLEPNNAGYWDRVGLYEEWNFLHGNIHGAIADFQRATQLDPRSARHWMALAGAYEVAGETAQARRAYERAQADHPVSADVAWRFGSFLLRHGDWSQAALKIHRALLDEPELTGSAVSQFWKAGAAIQMILNHVLPDRRRVYLAAITYFLAQNEDDPALACWQRLARSGQKISLQETLPLIDHLLAGHRGAQAAQVWQEALAASAHPGAASDGSLIFNGDFAYPFVEGGFGWRQSPVPGTAFDLVTDVTHDSPRAARVVFDGSANVDYANLWQFVPVTPGTRYQFSAFMRTDSISSASGPQFQLRTCSEPSKVEGQTPVMTGTHPWTRVQAEFTTGPTEHCVVVRLRRKPSPFGSHIRGAVWIDHVQLKRLPASGTARP